MFAFQRSPDLSNFKRFVGDDNSEMGASCLDTIQDDGKLFDKKIVLLITKMMCIMYFKTNCNV